MPMFVTISDAGNPDHRQDPARSVTGLRPRQVEVKDFAEASQVCQDYIRKHELGSGNWTGGAIKKGIKEIAKVSFNGVVWPVPRRMNDKPLWAPEVREASKNPLDLHQWEVAILTIPGYGKIEVTGCFRTGTIITVPDKFKVNGERAEFIEGIEFSREDGVSKIPPFSYHPDGIWEKAALVTPKLLAAIQTAIETWYAGEGAAMVLRNELVDRRRGLFVEERNIGLAEAELNQMRAKADEIRADIEKLTAAIDQGPAPRI
ncbi:hypothetical protein ACVIGB_001059 [Bradyrhizobium sp. USDA 4341]